MPMIPGMEGMMGGLGGGEIDPAALQGPMPEDAPPELSPLDHLRQAIEHAQAALVAEPDDADSQNLAKVVQGLYSILATRQKEEQNALGNPSLQRVLARG